MKPKTKLQKHIVELSKKLPKITDTQEYWAYKHCLDHEATRLKNGTVTCLDCGHKWKDTHYLATTLDCTCPNCNTKLKVKDTRKQKFHDWAYYGIVTTFQGFQVFRYYKVNGVYKAGKPVHHNFYEVSQIWLSPDGKFEIVGYIHQSGYYAENWSGLFELRNRNCIHSYDIKPYKVYPRKSIIQEVKRNGYRNNCYGYTMFGFFTNLLSDSKFETLLKAGQYDLIKYNRDHHRNVEKYWQAIKICIRNNYKIIDASLWIDYIKFLDYFDKDIRNMKYVCPENLNEVHDYWMKKKQKAEEKRRIEEAKLKALEDKDRFEKLKGKFFGIAFSDGTLDVKILESILEYQEEGKAMKHCVGGYALHENSLVFSARIKGKRVETIEVSLKSFEVVQSRGVCNKNTEYHDRIISLVNKNMHLIKERLKPKKNGTKKDVNRIPQAVDMAV